MARRRTAGGAQRAVRDATKLAIASAEAANAAAQTIALRSTMLARAAGDPRAMADPEFVRMVTEKMTAAALSSVAFAAHAPNFWRLWFGAASPWVLAGASARAASAALAPYRRATRANARRLSAKRRMP
jgi:hypothetical protein